MCREAHEGELTVEDVTPNTASLLVFSRRGYLKRMRADLFSPQACPSSSATLQMAVRGGLFGRNLMCTGTRTGACAGCDT